MKIYILPLLVLSFLISSCKSNTVVTPPTVKLTDYTFETTPNNLDNVGYVFAVNRDKMQIPITMLNLDPIEGTIVVPTNSSTREMSLGALIKFLGVPNVNITANADLNNTTKVTTTFALENPKVSRAFLTKLDSEITEKKESIKTVLISQNLQNADVYVILETIKTSKVTYDFSKSKIGKASLDAVFQNIASTEDSFKWNNSGSGSLSYDLKKDLTVFYKIFKIEVLPGAAGMDLKRGVLVKDSELIYTSKLSTN
ncbi:hypothetical protein [Flavobacterium sp.]|uniref:hypothetical protein n=1 Tax=Flavobacterium sp. TaxID=239 RepID=UPI003D0AF2F0